MLYPSMSDLMKRVNNRYMLVNLAAKRAREIAAVAEENEQPLTEKPVKTALIDIMEGHIALAERQQEEQEERQEQAEGETSAEQQE